ncbi:MAG: hypothetical protein ABIY52_05405 [Gemmatimonadaceae bacterium]
MNGKRAGAGAGGLLALGLLSVVTVGFALLGPLGMWIAAWVMRRQGEPATKFTSWLGAVYGVGMAVMLIGAVSLMKMTVGDHSPAYQRAMDSVRVAQRTQPPPAWLEKIAPGTTERVRASQKNPPTGKAMAAMGVGTSVIGAVMLGLLAGLLVGSLAWAACLPLYFAINGRWIGEQPISSLHST